MVDSNKFGGKKYQPLSSNDMLRLLEESKRGNLRMVVPEIVLRESANLWSELVAEEAKTYSKASTILMQAGVLERDDELEEESDLTREVEETRLRELLAEAKIEVAQFPSVTHEAVVERALDRRQPFDKNGRNGYRDVLLWETVLELSKTEGPIVLVSHDKRAFFEDANPDKGLARLLAAEVEACSAGKASVEVHYELASGIEAALALAKSEHEEQIAAQEKENAEALLRLNELLERESAFAERVSEVAAEALLYTPLGTDLRAYGIADSDVYGTHIDTVGDIERIEFTSAYVASDGDVLATLRGVVSFWAEITLHTADAVLLDYHPRVRISDLGIDHSVAEGQVELLARVDFDLTVRTESAEVTSLATVSELEPLTPEEFREATIDADP